MLESLYASLKSQIKAASLSTAKNVPINVPINEQDKTVLDLLENGPNLTRMQIEEVLGKSEKTVQQTIKKLADVGLIVRVGSKKAGFWRVQRRTE